METEKKTVTRTFTIKSYRCKLCGTEFIHKVNFDLHYKNHFENEKMCSFIEDEKTCSFMNIFSKCA
jgi:hypothetical protein